MRLLRGADAGGAQTHSIDVRPMAELKFGRGREHVSRLPSDLTLMRRSAPLVARFAITI
jgi:hypothetical protein